MVITSQQSQLPEVATATRFRQQRFLSRWFS
ncbi:Uncharacterised protein [Vibrio cholerae]|nr:Uncharacterised protein [Vibrio cholerae]